MALMSREHLFTLDEPVVLRASFFNCSKQLLVHAPIALTRGLQRPSNKVQLVPVSKGISKRIQVLDIKRESQIYPHQILRQSNPPTFSATVSTSEGRNWADEQSDLLRNAFQLQATTKKIQTTGNALRDSESNLSAYSEIRSYIGILITHSAYRQD